MGRHLLATSLLFVFLCLVLKPASLRGESISAAIDKKLQHYDKRVKPGHPDSPVEISVTMYVIDIGALNPESMEFTATFYFRQFWHDPRLANIGDSRWDGKVTGDDINDRVWQPDTFFVNDKDAMMHTMTVPNSFTRIDRDGNILRSIRVTTTSACQMDLRYFPMDTQTCTIELESYGFTAKDIVYKWKYADSKKSVGVADKGDTTVDYELVGHEELTRTVILSTGNYSRLLVEFEFERIVGYYLISVYVPTMLLVALSWLSFLCVGRKSSVVRAALVVSALVTLVVLAVGTHDSTPQTSYVRALDVFFFGSFVLALAALVQFAAVDYIANSGEDGEKRLDSSNRKQDGKAAKVDKYSLIAYPVVYLLFNLVYWIVYLNGGDDDDDDHDD